jgi:GntR family transcriptional regulator
VGHDGTSYGGRDQHERQSGDRNPSAPSTRAPVRLLEQCGSRSCELSRARVRRYWRDGELRADKASITSTMFPVKPNRGASVELHEQVAAQIRRAIADGEARPGDRLPSARDLAAVLGVNRNTVLRALRTLRDEGILDFTRGRGVTVTGTQQHTTVIEHAREFVKAGREHGYRIEELVDLVEAVAAVPGADRANGGGVAALPAQPAPTV